MKRKRGKKKGKAKRVARVKSATAAVEEATSEAVVNLISLSREENDDDGNDGSNSNDDGYDSPMDEEVNTPSSTGTDQPVNLASIKPDGSIDNESKSTVKSVGRVYKVKLKSSSNSKVLESQSDTDKSSPPQPQLGSEKQLQRGGSEVQPAKIGIYYSRNSWKRPGSIKIKSSSKSIGDGGLSSAEKGGDEKNGGGDNPVVVVAAEQESLLPRKEVKTPWQESRYDKQELDSSLTVIKKVMKMDAAEPFNVPVNPEALGIPDYFDVIDKPMDFGTVCNNLENGEKYKNSEDVYKDVQYIWDNCYKYNNKGDYILDLMRRVKKNFMKYWVAAGLYTEQSKGSNGSDRMHGDDSVMASQVKSSQPKKTKKRHGRRHKHDCLCAICVLKRRRREREENARLAKGLSKRTDEKHSQEFKQETSSPVESPGGEDSSMNTGESLDGDVEVEIEGQEMRVEAAENKSSPMEEKPDEIEEEVEQEEEEEEEEEEDEDDDADEEENELDIQKQGKGEMSVQSQSVDTLGGDANQQTHTGMAENSVSTVPIQTHKSYVLGQQDLEITAVQENKRKFQELKERQEKVKMFKKYHVENPLLLSLCGTLFPDNGRSVWRGPHSLFRHQGSTDRGSIHAAMETLMK